MKKNRISIIFNILIAIFESIGLYLTFKNNGKFGFEFYTEDSNFLALICSTLYVIFLLKNKDKLPKWLKEFKYISTIGLTITFLVVLFVLMPLYHFNYQFLLFKGSLLYHHLICPILAIISFIFFDDVGKLVMKDTLYGLVLTLIYSVVLVTLNILHIVVGPYPFLMVYSQSLYTSIIWFICLTSFSFLISYALMRFYMIYRYKGNNKKTHV